MNNIIEKKSIPVVEELLKDESLMHDLSETTTPEEVMKAFAKHDITIPAEMANEVFEKAHDTSFLDSIVVEDTELQENDLENVTGGAVSALAIIGAIGAAYIGGCAIAFILGSAYESKEGKAVRKWFKKKFG